MIFFETFIVIVGAVIFGLRYLNLRKRRAAAAAPQVVPASAVPKALEAIGSDTLAQALQRVATVLEELAESGAHPRDALNLPEFQEAVRRLTDPAITLDTVRQYAVGGNAYVAVAALEALSRRYGRETCLNAIITQFSSFWVGTLHFGLRYLDSLPERLPVGAAFALAQPWWPNNNNAVDSLRESLARREAFGDAAEFGDWLERPDAAGAEIMQSILMRIDSPLARGLREIVSQRSAEKIDERKLAGFGRFWSDDDWVFLVEPDAWRGDLDRAEKAVLAGRSVLVGGEVRGGKSAFLKLLGARLKGDRWRVFEAGAAELMAGQMYFGQLEGRLRETAAELNIAKRVAWCVGDMGLFAESGAHQNQPASALDQVMPNVTGGRLVLLGEGTREGVARLLQGRPSLRNQLEVLRLEPMDDAALKVFAEALTDRLNAHSEVKISPSGAEAVQQLARQYFTQQPSPGILADLMKRALQHAIATNAKGVDTPEVIAALSQITGLPQAILDDRDRLDLKAVRQYFAERVIGQDEAVSTVVDRIAMLKAGLVDPQRPVGVFFFAGPTGTGKTELAKTLAEFLFGSPERMARLDMSEFQSPDSVVKIVGERGRSTTDSLVERVRKQPFSVILLDEFEKAHSNIWDLFLQVFDDGRLTDANGHVADFRHCIIILTSNLGAIAHRSAGIGFTPSKDVYGGEQILKAVMQAFRPEFVNRLDKVVVFQPLSRDLMRAILAKELAQVLERRGLRNRDWAVEWEPSAMDFLLDRGFSPEMGARPLKRAIDQHLLAPLAATLVEHRFPEGDQFLFVRSDGEKLEVEFVDPDAEPDAPKPATPRRAEETSLADMILAPVGGAAEAQALTAATEALLEALASPEWSGLKARLTAEASAPDIWQREDRRAVFARVALIDRVGEAGRTAERLAERLRKSDAHRGEPSRELIRRLALQLHLLDLGMGDAWADAPVDAALIVEPILDDGVGADAAAIDAWVARLNAMYRGWAERRHMQLETVAPPPNKRGASILRITGFGAFRTLAPERGLHVLEEGSGKTTVRTVARVRVAAGPREDPLPAHLHAALMTLIEATGEASTVTRRYRETPSPLVRDAHAGWRSGRVEAVLAGDFDLIGLVADSD